MGLMGPYGGAYVTLLWCLLNPVYSALLGILIAYGALLCTYISYYEKLQALFVKVYVYVYL